MGAEGWIVQCKLECLIWLGVHKSKRDILDSAPRGYETPDKLHKVYILLNDQVLLAKIQINQK